MHENEKNNAKGRVKQTYQLKERKTQQEFWKKTTKNFGGALPSRRERKDFRKVLKRCLNKSKLSLNRFDQSNQTEAH